MRTDKIKEMIRALNEKELTDMIDYINHLIDELKNNNEIDEFWRD